MPSRSNTSRRAVLTALLAGAVSVPLLGAAPASSAPAAVLALPSPTGARPDRLGPADPTVPLLGERSWYITRDFTRAFFGLHLRGLPQPLLQGRTPSHPEVRFHRP
ncbi:hypothetical protein [Streptomyces sp. NPDC127039]|uniref:hypothetical protein n=1 Tax=Streptomyces sp. NPDC127039 TaxID=3347115 RepID=UPI0036493C44